MNHLGPEEIEEQHPVDVVKQLELDDSDDEFDENEYLMTFDQYNQLKPKLSGGFLKFLVKNQPISAHTAETFAGDIVTLQNYAVFNRKCSRHESKEYIQKILKSGNFIILQDGQNIGMSQSGFSQSRSNALAQQRYEDEQSYNTR